MAFLTNCPVSRLIDRFIKDISPFRAPKRNLLSHRYTRGTMGCGQETQPSGGYDEYVIGLPVTHCSILHLPPEAVLSPKIFSKWPCSATSSFHHCQDFFYLLPDHFVPLGSNRLTLRKTGADNQPEFHLVDEIVTILIN